jgi:hypothetical protein
MSDTIDAYAYVAELVSERNRLAAAIESVAVSLRDEADDTTDEQTAARLRDLASQLVRGE